MKKNGLYGIILALLAVAIGIVAIVFLTSKPPEVTPVAPAPKPVASVPSGPAASPQAPAATPGRPDQAIIEMPVEEVRYLPEKVAVLHQDVSASVSQPEIPAGNHRLGNIRQITSKEKNGVFMSPRLSPDGLQMIVTRPGFSGLFVVGAEGGDPVKIADANAYKSKWTKDGKIEILDSEGNKRIYSPDGILESVEPYDPKKEPVFAENDTVYLRPSPDQAPIPLTSDDDRYFNPVLSPDGKYVAFQGLYSGGLYVAPADGSEAPRFIGSGGNPTWMPDSRGFVFDRTTDDGHNLTEGDLYYMNVTDNEINNLTPGDGKITQMPSPGPDGQIAYEQDGQIFTGQLR